MSPTSSRALTTQARRLAARQPVAVVVASSPAVVAIARGRSSGISWYSAAPGADAAVDPARRAAQRCSSRRSTRRRPTEFAARRRPSIRARRPAGSPASTAPTRSPSSPIPPRAATAYDEYLADVAGDRTISPGGARRPRAREGGAQRPRRRSRMRIVRRPRSSGLRSARPAQLGAGAARGRRRVAGEQARALYAEALKALDSTATRARRSSRAPAAGIAAASDAAFRRGMAHAAGVPPIPRSAWIESSAPKEPSAA